MTSKLGAALRSKFKSPKDALKALGLDESLLREAIATDSNEGIMDNRGLAQKINAIANRTVTVGALVTYLKPRLAMDSKVDLSKALAGVTGKNFAAKKPEIAASIRSQAKLAKDASLDDVEKVLDLLEKHEVSEGADESVSEPQHKAMEAAAHGNSTLGIPEKVGKEFVSKDAGMENLKGFLKEKGMADDDIMKACDMLPKSAMDEEPDEAAKKKAEEEEKEASAKAAKDKAAKDAEMADMVKKPAMDAAIAAATDATAKRVREEARAVRKAERDITPYVGALDAMTFDSAEQVYRHALKLMKVPNADTVPAGALETILAMCPKAGAKPVERDAMGMDSSAVDKVNKFYPGIERIGTA